MILSVNNIFSIGPTVADPGFVTKGGGGGEGRVSKFVKRGGRMDDKTPKRADFA